jgi:hypothetical protein
MMDWWANACRETLFGSLKVERLHGMRFDTRRRGKGEVVEAEFDAGLHEPNVIRTTLARWSTKNGGSVSNHERNSLGGPMKVQAKSGR